jgi:hypothetical protein
MHIRLINPPNPAPRGLLRSARLGLHNLAISRIAAAAVVALCHSPLPLSPCHWQFMRALAGYVLATESGRLQNKIAEPWHEGHDAAKNVLL